jgi:hypothetical protein
LAGVLFLVNPLGAACWHPVVSQETTGPAVELLQQKGQLQARLMTRLQSLRDQCRTNQMPDAEAIVESWIWDRDPQRQYIFLPPVTTPQWPESNDPRSPPLRQQLTGILQEYAAALFELATRAARESLGPEAYQWLHETLVYDPDHLQARKALGFRQDDELGWVRSTKPTTAKLSRTRQQTIGWEKGTYWEINSPHFRIYSAAGEQAGLELAGELEQTYWVWRQVFFDYWCTPRQLQRWLDGESADKSGSRQYDVILFRDRQHYLNDLADVTGIAISSGYYVEQKRASFFYADQQPPIATWRHETVHQLLQENAGATKTVADRGQAWMVEGIAMYFESMLVRDNYVVLGGFDTLRLQYARLRSQR